MMLLLLCHPKDLEVHTNSYRLFILLKIIFFYWPFQYFSELLEQMQSRQFKIYVVQLDLI